MKKSSSDYLKCSNDKDESVTDCAIGEAALNSLRNLDYRLVSLQPSFWEKSPLTVFLYHNDEDYEKTDVINYISQSILEKDLKSFAPKNIKSWEDIDSRKKQLFPHLTFASNAFQPLKDYPFGESTSAKISKTLSILENLKKCTDKYGIQSPEAQELHKKYFQGAKACFSDSSATEKSKFREKLTFKHPGREGETLFCPRHGKLKSGNGLEIRIHYYREMRKSFPLYVVYIGEKITKK